MTSVVGHPLQIEPRQQAEDRALEIKRPATIRAWLLVFCAALLLYGFSTSSDVQWQDAGQYVQRVARGQLLDPAGLCRSHPLHFWISTAAAKVLPVPLPMAVGLVSALFGAVAIANVFGIVRQLTNRPAAAFLAAGGLAVAESFWQFSCVPGVHVVSAAILTLEFWALVNWDQTRKSRWLVVMFLANGIGWSNHNLALLTLPVIGVVLLLALLSHRAPWFTALYCALAWLAGASIYIWMILQYAHGHGVVEAIHSALVGPWGREVAGRKFIPAYVAASVGFTLLSFPNLMLPAALLGIVRGRRFGIAPLSFWALFASLAMHLVFVLRYNVITQYAFLPPAYALLAIIAGIGFAIVLREFPRRARVLIVAIATASIPLAPAVYVAASHVARHYHALGRYARHKPYRDDYRYLLIPWCRGEHSAQRMSLQATQLAGSNGLILAPDGMSHFAIDYQLFVQHKPDILLTSAIEPSTIAGYVQSHRPVVYVPFSLNDPPPALPLGHWQRLGDLYLLHPTQHAHAPLSTGGPS